MPTTADQLKRRVLMAIMALAGLSSALAWVLIEARGAASPVLRGVFGLNLVFQPIMIAVVRWRLLSMRVVDIICLAFATVVCAACMALRLYSPAHGGLIDLQALYLWIPVIYVFAFTLAGHGTSLRLSIAILALFIAISLPYLLTRPGDAHVNFTVQLHTVSAVLIAALYFFSSYQHRFQIAQLTVDQLARLANTDDLTRLANRRRMGEAISSELLRYARYGHVFSLILIDIDHFKAVNDRHGHAVGDQALVALAARTLEVLREVDTLGRWGGEEFVVILPATGLDETLQKATALCAHVAERPLVGDIAVTISCGVATVAPGDTAERLLQRADSALYAAKRHGRNRAEASTLAPAGD